MKIDSIEVYVCCSKCDGSGEYIGKNCERCKGTGYEKTRMFFREIVEEIKKELGLK